MTEEQIKQNAEKYATDYYIDTGTPYVDTERMESYIAGVHSLDEEIKELNARIVKLMCERDSIKSESEYLINKLRNDNKDIEQALACAEDVVDIQRKELEKLRNP